MSEKNKNGKAKKILFTVAATTAALTSPLLILAGNENVVENDGISTVFRPDRYVIGNKDDKEYTDIKTRYFGLYRKDENSLTTDQTAVEKLVKFSKTPTENEWNQATQSWEIVYDSGLFPGHDGYSWGQRAFGFSLSNDLSIVPGSIAVKLDYITTNSSGDKFPMSPDVEWVNPDIEFKKYGKDTESFYSGPNARFEQEQNALHRVLGPREGFYLRIADKNGNIVSTDPFKNDDEKKKYWIKNYKFDTEGGSLTKGALLYTDKEIEKDPEKNFSMNIFPMYGGKNHWFDERPRINAIEYLTAETNDKGNEISIAPRPFDNMFSYSRADAPNVEIAGLSNFFGPAIVKNDTDQSKFGFRVHKKLEEANQNQHTSINTYDQFANNVGTLFLINLDNGLVKNPYWDRTEYNDLRPGYKITLQFKTERKYKDVLNRTQPLPDENSPEPKENAYLKKSTDMSFVSGIYHADYYEYYHRFKPTEKFSADPTASSNGDIESQFSAEATSFATRTDKRNIKFNLTENIEHREGKDDKFPKISGYNVYKDNTKIDSIKIDWDDLKNKEVFIKDGKFQTQIAVNLDTLNLSNISDLDKITLLPYYSSDNSDSNEGLFKWNTSSSKFKFNQDKGILTGSIDYKISDEQKKKEELEEKFVSSKLPSDLLFEDTQLADKQRSAIRAAIGTDYARARFDGHSAKSGNSTLYNDFWTDLIKSISKANKEKEVLTKANVNITDSVNYRLSDNKKEVDELIKEINKLKSQDLETFKIGQSYPSKEIYFESGIDPRTIDFKDTVDKFDKAVQAMNGQAVYDKLVQGYEKVVANYANSAALYQLAKSLNNNKDKADNSLLDIKALQDNVKALEDYLKTTVTKETLDNYKEIVDQYLSNFGNNSVVAALAATADKTESPEYKLLSKWFAGNTEEFNKILDTVNINKIADKIPGNAEGTEQVKTLTKQLADALYTMKYYSDFAALNTWYPKEESAELPKLEVKSLNYEPNDQVRTRIHEEIDVLPQGQRAAGFKANILEFIKHKNEVLNELSTKLNALLQQQNFNYWDLLGQYAKDNLGTDVISDVELQSLISPLKLAVTNVNNFENLAILSDTGLQDVIYSYIFNNWLLKSDKYALLDSNAKQEVTKSLKDLFDKLATVLKENAQAETLRKNSLGLNDTYLETILDSKMLLKDSKTVANTLLNSSNGTNLIKPVADLEKLLNNNIQFSALKAAAAAAKTKAEEYANVKNQEVLNKFKKEIDDSITTEYKLSSERIAQDQGSAFYETNATVKEDWKSFGDFYSLNNLSKENYAKEFKDLKEATDANVDQFYKAKLDELKALNDKIDELVKAINVTGLSSEAKEALTGLAQQSATVEAVEAIQAKLNTVVEAYKKLDDAEKAANNVKTQSENNYKFASNEPKLAFDSLLASLSEKKAEINKTEVTKADDLDKVVSALNTLTQEITTKQGALDGEKQLKDLQDKVTVQDLPAYTEDQIQGLKDALAKTADLDAAKAKATQYSEFNSQVAAAKELVAKFDEITRENKYINATSDKKSAYDTSAKALKQFVEGYQAKIEEYKTNNSDTWTNNLPTMKSELSKIVDKYNQDLKALDGDKALEDAKKAKNDLIDKFANISDSLKATFKEKINQETTTQNVDAKFNELKDIDAAYGATINPLTKLQGLINSDKFEALNGEPEYNTIKEDLAKIEKNFDNKKGNVDLTKEKVEELLSQINSDSKTIETKYEEFNRYCEEQKNKIDELESLANGQKETLKRDIDRDKNKAQVNATVETATKLNTSMKNLREIYAQAEKVKTTPKYLNASNEPKANFDQQLSDELVNPDGQIATDPSTIDDIAETLKDAIDRLDGDIVLNKAKEDANKEIDKLTNLSETQKAAVKAGISSANEVKDINDLVNKAKTFDKSIQDLKDQVATDTNNKQTTKYQQADKEPKEAYDAKAQAVADKLKELQELSLDNNLANATAKETEGASAIQAAKEAYAGLNGDNKLADAKSKANGALDALNNLNSQVIDNFKQEIAQANDVTTVNSIKDKAVAQNTLVGDIVSSLSQAEALKQNNSVYNKATQEQKEALENAIKDVKDNILDSSAKKMKPNNLTDQLQAKKDAIDNAIKAINKLSGEITEAQNKAKEEINKLPNLTQAQKDALNAKVDAATSIQAIDGIVTEAKTLDTATRALREAIAKGNEVDKGANNYKFADEYNQKHFDAMAIEAKAALESGLADKNAEVINSIAQKLMQAIEALNGDAKLNANRDAAKETVDKLDNLTKEQKDSIKDKITNAKDDAEVKNLTAAAEKLNKALKEAQEAAKAANTAKDSDNYKQASQTPKNNFDSKKQALDSEINTAKETNTFENADAINKLADELTKATEDSNTAKDALDGDKLLADAKAKAQSALNNAKHLSEDYKKALQEQINNAKEVAKLEQLATNIPALDTAAGKLAEAATKLAQAINDPEYANASEETKAKVAQAQNQNKDLLTNSLLNNGKDNSAIQAALEANNAALEAIKADKEALATARTKAKEELAKLTNLSKAQKDDITSKINEANTVANVTAVLDNAKVINTKMGELIEWNQKIEEAKGQTKYTQASDNVKKNFDTIYNAQKNIWLKDNQVSIDPSVIDGVINGMKGVYNTLDGDKRLSKAKEDATKAVEALTNIDQKAKDAAKEAIAKTQTVDAVNAIAAKETALDKAVADANTAVQVAKALKETPQYKEAADDKQQAFDNAIKALEDVVKTAKEQANLEQVETDTNDLQTKKAELEKAQSALDGNTKLQAAKEAAKTVIDALENIDTPVKENFKNQLADKTSTKDIESVVDKAKATNTATKDLIQKIAKANELINKADYNVVPEDKKQALQNALKAAKDLLTAQGDKLKDSTEVLDINNAKENLSQAIIQASGQADEILKAQKAAKDEIDKLTNLTDQQKEALKHQVSSAVTNEGINAVVEKAKELDKVTKDFKDAINSAKELDKNSDKYKYADENKQKAFDNDLKDAEVELAKGLANKDKDQIKELSEKLAKAQGDLNGESKLADAKKDAQDKVQNLTNLSNEQKGAIKSAINNATSPEAANAIANKAAELDQTIAKAKEAQKAATEVKATPKYTEASDATKNPFDTNANKLDGDLTNATTTKDLDTVEKLDNLVKALTEDTTKTNDANAALDGQSRLDTAKAEANGVIAGASQLSPQAANTFKDTVDKAQTIAAVNEAKEAAKTAQEAAKALVDNLDKVNTALQNAGSTLDAATAKEASDAKDKANEFLEDNKLKQGADVAQVNKAAAKLAEVLGKIKANVDALKGAQNDAIDEINKLPNLSSTQKEALINEVKAAQSTEAVNNALTKAKELDKAIGQLKDNLASIETTKASDNYKLADVDKKNELDKVASDKDNIMKQAAAALDKSAIEALNSKINTAKEALNGNNNKQAAKEAIDALSNLSSNQKSAAKDTLNQAQDKAQLDAKVQEAKDLDSAKAQLQVAKESLDALINQFTKPNNISEAALSSFYKETKVFADNKKALEDAKEAARVALEATTLNADQVANALAAIAKAKETATNTIETTVANNNAIVSAANIANFDIAVDKEKATVAATKAVDKNANIYEDVVAAREVQHLAALDKFAKFQAALPQELKASTSFNDILDTAKRDLNNSNSKASDDEILAKIQHQLLKDKLALAYDAAAKENISEQIPAELKAQFDEILASARDMLSYHHTDVNTPKATYDNLADQLYGFMARNELANVIAKAQLAPKSSQLDAAIAQGKEALNNKDLTQKELKAASDKLVNETDKAKLYQAINNANDFVKELQEGNKEHHSALRDRIVNTLSNEDIPTAVAAASKHDTEAGYNTAAAALDNAVANAKKTIENVFKTLEELRDKIANMPQDQISAPLKEQLAHAQTIKKDSGVVAIENALENLQHKYATNELDKAIAAAPTINDKYATLVPSIVDQSQTVSNNPQASTQEIATQLAKQLLNNAKGNALNTLAGLNNLNNAQASALANAIAQAQDANQVANELKQAQDLDKAMATLKDTYAKVDEAYKSGTNLPYEAFFIPADKLALAKDAIAKAGKVTPETGEVYLDNLPAQIDQLNSDLNTALDSLGQGKGQAKAMEEEFNKLNNQANTLSNNLQVNSDKLFNSPQAIQTQVAQLQGQIKDLSDKYFNNHAAYMQEGNAKLKQLVDQLSNLNDQVDQFSPQVFTGKDSKRITQAQDVINNNSDYTSDVVANNNLDAFNRATTYQDAIKSLNDQVATNNDLKAKIAQFVANLTDSLNTKKAHPETAALLGEILQTSKPEIVKELTEMMQGAATILVADQALKTALNTENAGKAFKDQINLINNGLNALPQVSFAAYPEFDKALNTAKDNVKDHANGIKQLIQALDTRNSEELAQAIQLLNKVDKNNAKLAGLIQEDDYIGILNNADNKAITKDDLATVDAMKNSSEYQLASPAIQDLLNQDLSGKKPWAWWPIAVAVSAVAWIAGLLAILLKRK
ncbi:hypothetical protein ACNQ1X_00170 [Mycoplasma sp. SK341A]|uniref:hypothetical protein n=1 Tax=Mycoplasma sp. SK341A TaxID=3401679 RepID=UPI003AAD027D